MIRFATKEDRYKIAELVLIVLKDMALPFVEKAGDQITLEILEEAMEDPHYRYGWQRGLVSEVNGEVAGIAFGYPASEEETVDKSLEKVLAQHGLAEQSLFTDHESFAGEWYLDLLCVDEAYRGQGIASQLLTSIDKFALRSGATIVGLCVDHENKKAQQLYEKNGFKIVGEQMISQHSYHHMQKPISLD
ncbi:GNAT family N-acetyltransferase [Tetragenococcus koreensis]|uniref:GNAT family acetyltransferase n=1 Tax=Tetragenococcus koreensis TaxID=290335 RepID=A0AAN4UAF3_9ENTE|nr:GNAT family N-acetyltransferase [Tetragenococcus koreensis]AYW45460.1 GNAT family N-acetyltransferase [Tetragenococcus koreensis]MCF1584054.1 GNAT family N-acetyltransferase [Tetragenococcus koreensis]MCF1613515.1 GNAT family N-acetyltransferase [Tetragenococcus koreensis]MCF1616752.1 GNAT family N-acetyltransferase [Tetragenococcus koreensis]MCF1618746.1 GNAT family N-acetyltransferase [Tetragenococcus koreensis]